MAPRVSPVIIDQIKPIRGRRTGKAPAIRKLAIKYPDLSEAEIAKQVGCDPANVHRVLVRFRSTYTESELADFQENKADIYDAIQLRAIGSITDEKLTKTSVKDLAIAAGIWEDKARVIRGQATQINVSVLLDAVNLAKEMREKQAAEAMEKVRERMAAERNGSNCGGNS